MAVVQVAVEANGWVLGVTGDWPASASAFGGGSDTPHPDFPLAPDAAVPRVRVRVSPVSGHRRSGGVVVPDADGERWLVATKPLRRPWPDSSAGDPVLDEVDLGGGLRRVRLALSDRVFAGETIDVDFAADWRLGQPPTSAVPAANGSGRVPVVPICRWATPPYQLVSGVDRFRCDLLVASHYPRNEPDAPHQAIAGLRWFASDGVRVNSGWVTAPSTSGAHGDNLRCWGFEAVLAGLLDGVISVWAHVYPWIGAMRPIGSAATDASGHVANNVASLSVDANAVLHLCHEAVPGARYQRRFAFFDPSGGAVDHTAVVLHPDIAMARAASASSRPRDVSMLMRAMHTANVTLPAANGLPGGARSCDFWEGIVPAGATISTGITPPGSGFGAKEGYLVIRGDPLAADPVGDCRWQTNAASPANMNNARYCLRDLTLLLGGAALLTVPTGPRIAWTDRVRVRGKAGQELATQLVFANSAGPTGTIQFLATQTDWQGYGIGITGSNLRAGLVRNCRTARYSTALVFVSTEQVLDPTVDYRVKVDSFGGWASSGSNAAWAADQMLWSCRSLANNGRFYIPAASVPASSSAGGTGPEDKHVYLRLAVVNSVCVRANVQTGDKLVQIGENAWQEQKDCLWEGNTFVSHRVSFHNDPPQFDADLVQTGVSCRNNFWERISTKADTFSTASANRTGSWEVHYGVGWHGNIIGERSGIGDQFQFEFNGLRHFRPVPAPGPGTPSVANFVDDRSNWGPEAVPPGIDGVGAVGGNYRPAPGSVLSVPGRGAPANIDTDIEGRVRGASFAIGALEPLRSESAHIAPRLALHGLIAGEGRMAPQLQWMGGEAGVHALVGAAPAVRPAGLPAPPPVAEARTLRVPAESQLTLASLF